MKNVRLHPIWALLITVLMISMFATAVSAQKIQTPTLWIDTAINPHDFTDEHYASHGILAKAIIHRRTGNDLLSVISPSSDSTHTWVRVIATFPAYGPSEEMLFWYPLGGVNDDGFTEDKAGVIARQTASVTPLYVFPINGNGFTSFANMRQAALFGPAETYYPLDREPMRPTVRRIVEVRYTAKAFLKESAQMMQEMSDKNGLGTDGLPIIRSMADITMLAKHELVSFGPKELWDDSPSIGAFVIAPVIPDPTGGVIAPDAFLLMPTGGGKPVPSEQVFTTQFGCLQKSGYWCNK